MPGYLNRWEDCPTCGWDANYADHGLMPDVVTRWGTLDEARERYRLTGSIDPGQPAMMVRNMYTGDGEVEQIRRNVDNILREEYDREQHTHRHKLDR